MISRTKKTRKMLIALTMTSKNPKYSKTSTMQKVKKRNFKRQENPSVTNVANKSARITPSRKK